MGVQSPSTLATVPTYILHMGVEWASKFLNEYF